MHTLKKMKIHGLKDSKGVVVFLDRNSFREYDHYNIEANIPLSKYYIELILTINEFKDIDIKYKSDLTITKEINRRINTLGILEERYKKNMSRKFRKMRKRLKIRRRKIYRRNNDEI